MLYPSIILNSILNIISFKDFLSLLVIFLTILVFYISWNNFSKKKYIHRLLIILFRFSILVLIIPLIQNKIMKDSELISRKQKIGIIIDNSSSMQKILDSNSSIDIEDIIKQIQSWANSSNVDLFWYDLDGNIKPNELIFDKQSTSFDYIEKIITDENIDQLLLLSDGNINQGFLSDKVYANNLVKIHTIGLGTIEKLNQNIKINETKIKFLNDSINIETEFLANITQKESKVIFNIFFNSEINQVYSDTLLLDSGIYNFNKNIKLNFPVNTNKVLVDLEPLNFLDSKLYDNKWNININKNRLKNILFLTGKLTHNTRFLKNIFLNSPSNFNLTHWVSLNSRDELDVNINLSDYDYVLFDNFPSSDIHIEYLNKIYNLQIPILFFQGYDFDVKYLNEILDLYHPNSFYIENGQPINKTFSFDNNISMGSVFSNYNLFSNDIQIMDLKYFSNNSIYEINSPKLYVLLIPNISEIDFFMRTKYENNYLSNYIEYITHDILNDKEMTNLKLKKNNYLSGEKLLFDLDESKIPFDILESKIIIQDLLENQIDSINYEEDMSLYIENSGLFKVYFLFQGTNGEVINSNIENFDVEEDNVELDNISQNVRFLKDISSNSKGKYNDVYDLNFDYFKSIDNSKIITKYNRIYSALDLFIKEKIYLFLIILFSLEIFFRKKIGLL